MVWKELIPMIEFLLRRHPPPKFIVIQLGSNDLGTVKGWQLAENIICDILRIHTFMPNTLIVWYDILQLLWHEGYSALWCTLLYLLLGFLPRGSLVYEFFQ
jgi:hypothetical protein